MAEYIMQVNEFKQDLLVGNRDALVTATGDVVRIRKQLSNPEWLVHSRHEDRSGKMLIGSVLISGYNPLYLSFPLPRNDGI